MSRGSHDGETIELSFSYDGLDITVRGSPRKASRFLASVTSGSLAGRPASPSPTLGSFERVGSVVGDPVVSVPPRVESRDAIAAGFVPCPGRLLDSASKLSGPVSSAEGRIRRAWEAGQWARAVLAERIGSPNRTPPLEIRSRFYAVAKADGLLHPTIFKSSGSYFRAVGNLVESSSVSQAFPSELEARIYLEAAGFHSSIEVRP